MRRSTYLGLAAFLLLLGVYGAYWFIVAGRIADGFGQWAQSLRAQNLDLEWRAIGVGGFPLSFRVELNDARLRDLAAAPVGEVRTPLLLGSARPWNFRVWHLTAPAGLSATAGPADRPQATLKIETVAGSVAVGVDGGAAVWLGLGAPSLDAGVRLAAREADLWLNLPQHPPQAHGEPTIGVALGVRELTLPAVPAPLRNPLDEIAFGVTLLGPIPAAPPRAAASAWRDAGGTLELDQFALRWGTLAMTGSGTLALDRELQPIGSFSSAIEGYDELTRALVAAGHLRPNEARLAQVALAMLARTGPDGRPQIATSFRLQDGQMYLGPVKLGKAPRIAWP
ncbi:MAG TPA: DUF2125 domain-containing protein [Stellaceae bacterium]|jgi:hypothetical protein|nr:DUF2125 domain-containing protein [Stellaceae bacterium]